MSDDRARGSKTLTQRASEGMEKIRGEHTIVPWPAPLDQAVRGIIERAEARYA